LARCPLDNNNKNNNNNCTQKSNAKAREDVFGVLLSTAKAVSKCVQLQSQWFFFI
jgi:hypothetical protein